MPRLSIPPVIKIFSVIVIIVIGLASAFTIYVIRQTNIQTTTKASSPEPAARLSLFDTPATPSPTPKTPVKNKTISNTPNEEIDPLPSTTPTATPSAIHRSNPAWVYTATGSIDVIPMPNGLKNTLYIDFEADTFANISSISYILTYNSGLTATPRSVQGTIVPGASIQKIHPKTKRPYIRKSIFLGTCSQNVCTPETNTNTFKININLTLSDNNQELIILEAFSL